MQPIRKILVPLDGSPVAEQALPLAARVAAATGARLEMVTVHHPVSALALSEVPLDPTTELDTTAGEAAYLTSRAEGVPAQLRLETGTAILEGAVVPALATHVAEAGVDLVVMTTHGRGPVSRFWIGSVADALIRRLHVPILLIRPAEKGGPVPDVPPFQRILIPLDGSTGCLAAIEPAVALGHPVQTEYRLLRVVEPPVVPLAMSAPYPVAPDPLVVDELDQQAREYLNEIAAEFEARGFRARTQVLVQPGPASGILEVADRTGADLVAIATRAASGLERVLLGSVADKVVRGAHQPVLVVPPAATP
jgi:nucleotide-binding universal stress UspA family protein